MNANALPRARPLAVLAAVLLLGSALAIVLATPATATLSASGVWIFPHERQEKVLDDELGQYFYNTTSGDDWIADAFFADAQADNATVEVDFYNPTSGNLTNVILWVAVNDDDLFTSINFSGGSSGNVSVDVGDLGGGTPTTSASLPSYVYPAFYTSYGVGDVAAGTSGIETITMDVTGDFDGGLVLRLDYVATNASDDAVSGPFDAGMTIYEWGDLPADEDTCPDEKGLTIGGTLTQGEYADGKISFVASISLGAPFEYEASNVTATLQPSAGLSLDVLPGGDIEDGVGTLEIDAVGGDSGNYSLANVSLSGSPLLLDGDNVSFSLHASWDGCDDGGETSTQASLEVELDPSGGAKKAQYWSHDLKDALKDERRNRDKADHNTSQFATFMQAVALHSAVFTYGPWEGEDPLGGEDEGWVDISDLEDALDVLRKSGGHGNGRLKEAQQELLALWLNIATGRVNLDSDLKVWKKHIKWGEDRYSKGDVPGDVQRIVSYAESNLTDYVDASDDKGKGHKGAGKALRLAANLCGFVNTGWLRLA